MVGIAYHTKQICSVNKNLTTGYSLFTLSAMNFERYLGIIHPLVHRVKLTKKKLLSSVFSACTVYTVALPMFFNTVHIRKLLTGTWMLLFLTASTYIYIRIFLAAKKSHSLPKPPNAIADKESTAKEKKE